MPRLDSPGCEPRECGFAADAVERLELLEREPRPVVWVYAITDYVRGSTFSEAAIKVGCTTKHPCRRKDELQTANPHRLTLVAYSLNITEPMAHYKLWRFRVGNGGGSEWFKILPELLDYIVEWDWVVGGTLKVLREQCGAREHGAPQRQRPRLTIAPQGPG
jgi:hypothetical protein